MALNSTPYGDHLSIKVRENLFIFPSDLKKNPISSWWLDCDPEPVLIDCPLFSNEIIKELDFLAAGRTGRILLTNRDSHGMVKKFQAALGWPVLVQEQESYLLPELPMLESFSEEYSTISGLRLLWTPGPTPGSCVVHAPAPWNVLFCGRLLTPVSFDSLTSLRTKKTFHWTTQKKSIEKLRNWIPSDPLPLLAPGFNPNAAGCVKLFPWKAWKK